MKLRENDQTPLRGEHTGCLQHKLGQAHLVNLFIFFTHLLFIFACIIIFSKQSLYEFEFIA